MTWFGELRRRLSALFGWLRRPGQGAAPPLSLPPSTAVRASEPSETAREPAAAPSVVVAVQAVQRVAGPAPAAAASVAAASPAAPVVASRVSPPQPGAPTMDPSLGQLKARQYFARMIAATPAGLTIDFSDWRSASVERFFMAMTSPGLTRRREAPTSGVEQVSLPNAFQGFEWD